MFILSLMIGWMNLKIPKTATHRIIYTMLPGSLNSSDTINEHKNKIVTNVAARIK